MKRSDTALTARYIKTHLLQVMADRTTKCVIFLLTVVIVAASCDIPFSCYYGCNMAVPQSTDLLLTRRGNSTESGPKRNINLLFHVVHRLMLEARSILYKNAAYIYFSV